jgi:hypothetical protein
MTHILVIRLSLLVGGLFNLSMGMIFLSNNLLRWFFSASQVLEKSLFGRDVELVFPPDPLHQLLIHGFGAGVVILGVTLLYSIKNIRRLLPFILFDGVGRLLFGIVMLYYVLTFSLPRTILLFGALEISLGLIYIWGSWSFRATSNEQ